jgi:hypothetical protein
MDNEYIERAKRYRKKGFLSQRFQTFYFKSALQEPVSFTEFCNSFEDNQTNVIAFNRKESIEKSASRNLEIYRQIQHKIKKEIRI